MTDPDDLGQPRDDAGRFAERMSLRDVYAALDAGEPYTTREIAQILEVPMETARYYLEQLHDQDHVRKKNPTGVVIWTKITDQAPLNTDFDPDP